MANLFELAAKLTLDSSSYDSGIDSAKGKAETFGSKLKSGLATAGKVTAAAIGTATAAVTAFAKSSVESGMKFDTSMSQVAATMGTTVDQIQDLRDFAQEMGSKTAFSATQAADALNYMALAGYDAKASMDMLPNVLNLAAAGGMELASASDMITDSQSALGLTLDETSKLVDKMAKASSKSNTSVAQLGEAILTVGGTAKNLAGGTTELSAALGILADNGTKGAEGGTKLRNIILSLGAPTDTAAKALNKLGVTAYDADGNMRPLQDTFSDLNKAMENMTTAEKTDIINTVFNKTDIKDVNALLATSADRWDELSAAIDESAGAAQAMADTQLDNLAGDVTLFQSALEGAQIALSDALTPAMREFVQFGSQGLSELTEAFKSGDFGAVVSTFEEILTEALNRIIEKLPQFISVGTDILLALVNGIISVLPTLGTAAFEIVNHLASSIADTLPTLIPAAYEAVMGFVIALTDPNNLSSLVDGAIALIMGLADGLIAAIPIMTENAPIIVENLATAIIDNTPKLLDAALKLMLALAEGLITNLPTILAAQWKIYSAILSALWDFAGTILNWLGELCGNVLSAVGSWFGNLIANVVSFTSNIAATIMSFMNDLPNKIGFALGYVLGSIVKFGANVVSWVKTDVPKIITSAVDFVAQLPGKIWNFLVQTISKIVQFGSDMKAKAVKAAADFVVSIVNGMKNLPSKMGEIGRNVVKGLWNGITNVKGWILSKIKGFGKSILSGIKSAFGIASPSKYTAEDGKYLVQGLAKGILDNAAGAKKAAAKLSDDVLGVFNSDGLAMAISDLPDLNTDISTPLAVSNTTMNTESNTDRLLMMILEALTRLDDNMKDKIKSAIDGMGVNWNDRELGRFVKSYA